MKDNLCPVCKQRGISVSLKASRALENTVVAACDIFDCGGREYKDGVTLSKTGRAVLVDCEKCPRCGFSVRRTNKMAEKIFGV